MSSSNITRRCVYCRPAWAFGVRRWSFLGRLYNLIWPPHIIGEDFGPPYTDGLCDMAVKKMEERDAKNNCRR